MVVVKLMALLLVAMATAAISVAVRHMLHVELSGSFWGKAIYLAVEGILGGVIFLLTLWVLA